MKLPWKNEHLPKVSISRQPKNDATRTPKKHSSHSRLIAAAAAYLSAASLLSVPRTAATAEHLLLLSEQLCRPQTIPVTAERSGSSQKKKLRKWGNDLS